MKTVSWKAGKANIAIQREEDDAIKIELNIEKRSSVLSDHEAWLKIDITEFKSLAKKLLTEVLLVADGDITDG